MIEDSADEAPQPVDLPLELAGESDETFRAAAASWRWPWWQWLTASSLVAIGLWVIAWILPNEQLETRKVALSWCIAEDIDDEMDPETCRTGSLWLARLSPLTRERALYVRARGDYEAERRRLFNTLITREGAAARNQAANALAEATGRVRANVTSLRRNRMGPRIGAITPVEDLLAVGALDRALDLGVADIEQGKPANWGLYPAVIARGELTQLLALTRVGDEYAARATRIERGAWLCLLGEREAGASLLREATAEEEANQRAWAWADSRARLALTACTDGEDEAAGEATSIRRRGAEVWLAAREAARSPDTTDWGEPDQKAEQLNLPTLAQAIVHGQPETELLLRWVRADREGLAPWVALSERARALGAGKLFPPGLPVYGPDALMQAAMFTAARADEALAAGLAFTPPTEDAGAVEGELSLDEFTGPSPAEQLSQVAGLLALEAAVEQISRGKFERAREAARLALSRLLPDQQWRAAWPSLSAGDLVATLAWTQARRAQITRIDEWRELGRVELEALALLGRFAAARTCLAELEALPLDPHESAREQKEWKSLHLTPWRTALAELGDEGVPTRSEPLRFMQGALPNLGWAFAARERDDADTAEQWLDARFSEHLRESGRAALWARVDEARRLGETHQEERWRERADELFALIVDEDTALLLDSTGL